MSKNSQARRKRFFALQRKYLCIPYVVFLILFVIIPIFIIVAYAFTKETTNPVTGVKSLSFSFDAAVSFFTSWSKINDLFVSLFIALLTTLICLLIGYPLAYF